MERIFTTNTSENGGRYVRAGVVIEMFPERFVAWRIRAREATIHEHTEMVDILSCGAEPTRSMPTLSQVRIELDGFKEPWDLSDPSTWATEPQREIAPPARALPPGSGPLALPGA